MSFEFEARFFCGLLRERSRRSERVLIVGCGNGTEARHIAQQSGARVFGLDVGPVDARESGGAVHLLRADARHLPFRDGAFDAVYCYHVLEHVPGPEAAVAEARRVLHSDALAFFGTPNKSRLVGYAGGRGQLWNKVKWNLVDYWKRVTGQWSNEKGAHAGFSPHELERLVGRGFERVESVSLPYYLGKYPRLAGIWRTTFRLGLARFVAPSVYVRATSENGASSRAVR